MCQHPASFYAPDPLCDQGWGWHGDSGVDTSAGTPAVQSMLLCYLCATVLLNATCVLQSYYPHPLITCSPWLPFLTYFLSSCLSCIVCLCRRCAHTAPTWRSTCGSVHTLATYPLLNMHTAESDRQKGVQAGGWGGERLVTAVTSHQHPGHSILTAGVQKLPPPRHIP